MWTLVLCVYVSSKTHVKCVCLCEHLWCVCACVCVCHLCCVHKGKIWYHDLKLFWLGNYCFWLTFLAGWHLIWSCSTFLLHYWYVLNWHWALSWLHCSWLNLWWPVPGVRGFQGKIFEESVPTFVFFIFFHGRKLAHISFHTLSQNQFTVAQWAEVTGSAFHGDLCASLFPR